MQQFTQNTSDNAILSIHTFDIESPKAVIQIVHGMEEHQERYEAFASFLNQNGYSVVTSDLRGHGTTAKSLGHFKDKKGYLALVEDQMQIRAFIAERYPDTPVYLFAHSMGTIISRVLLQTESKQYQKVVLSGYPCYQLMTPIGIPMTAILRLLRGPEYKSKFIQNVSVGVFNKAISNPKTDIDWVCANTDTVQAYMNDPYCGIGFTCAAFNDLYHLVLQMHKPKAYKNVHTSLPLLMLCGIDDPCTGGQKGTADSIRVLSNAGFQQIERIDYPGMRHEILNEKDYQTVYQNILDFYNH